MPELPAGWGATELAEHRAQQALDRWDHSKSADMDLSAALALAETMRTLLSELDTDRRLRHA